MSGCLGRSMDVASERLRKRGADAHTEAKGCERAMRLPKMRKPRLPVRRMPQDLGSAQPETW